MAGVKELFGELGFIFQPEVGLALESSPRGDAGRAEAGIGGRLHHHDSLALPFIVVGDSQQVESLRAADSAVAKIEFCHRFSRPVQAGPRLYL